MAKKRSRAERRARHERRLAGHEAKRRRASRREVQVAALRAAAGAYVAACVVPEGLRGERCVCERCGLEQELARGVVDELTGEVHAAPCQGFDGIGCGSEVAVTVESYLEAA